MIDARISAKDLGALVMPDFCPRCFWIKRNIKKLPWQIFPGIFSSIDSYTKKMVHNYFDILSAPPPWLPEIKDAKRYLKTLHWSKFIRRDPETGITVSGVTDDVFECEDLSRIIVDYKTAKFTENADKLFPIYEVQLNGYAWVEEGFGSKVRDDLPLIYCEPVTEPDILRIEDTGFNMSFLVKSVLIKKQTEMIPALLKTVHDILSNGIPASNETCEDCTSLDNILGPL